MLRVRRFDTLVMDNSIIFGVQEENVRRELQQAALLRAIYSRRQLYEVMVDFWSDHFSISTLKGDCAWLKTIDDREVIRPHALGNFGELLWASMHSPAMLHYLDNQENHAGGPNENYARELLELHTLGVTAGYTQRDVQEVARGLTGWTVDDHLFRGQFRFTPEQHDDGAKTVLGHTIRGRWRGERRPADIRPADGAPGPAAFYCAQAGAAADRRRAAQGAGGGCSRDVHAQPRGYQGCAADDPARGHLRHRAAEVQAPAAR